MNIKPIRLKPLIFWVGSALLAGGIGALLGGNTDTYKEIVKPPLSPPSIVFPIVWSILYVLIGLGAYVLSGERTKLSSAALKVYLINLVFNSLWQLIFFRLEAYNLAALWLGIIVLLTFVLVFLAYKINKKAFLLFLPYLIWVSFALYLSIGVAILN